MEDSCAGALLMHFNSETLEKSTGGRSILHRRLWYGRRWCSPRHCATLAGVHEGVRNFHSRAGTFGTQRKSGDDTRVEIVHFG